MFDDAGGTGVVSGAPIGHAVSRIVGEIGCAGPQTAVGVPSTELRTILHQRLGVAADQPLTCADLERLTTLFIVQRYIQTLEGLQFAINLTQLTCNQCVLTGIAPVSRLRKLTALALAENGITDVTPLAGLVGLTSLDLQFNRITDVTALAGLTNLTILNLRGNVLDGVDPLAGLTELRQLFLRETRITSASPLVGLVNLENLTLSFNQLTTLAGLQGMTKLGHLEVYDNWTLSDIGALTHLDALAFLDAENNSIADIAPLAGKSALTTLDLSGNQIADLRPVAWGALPLTRLDLRSNLITDITPLQTLGDRRGSRPELQPDQQRGSADRPAYAERARHPQQPALEPEAAGRQQRDRQRRLAQHPAELPQRERSGNQDVEGPRRAGVLPAAGLRPVTEQQGARTARRSRWPSSRSRARRAVTLAGCR